MLRQLKRALFFPCPQTLTVGAGAGMTVINNIGSIALAQLNVPGVQVCA
jgi:hypothetical protein